MTCPRLLFLAGVYRLTGSQRQILKTLSQAVVVV
jgi:hypothetical protein